jgi:hypothetical protein
MAWFSLELCCCSTGEPVDTSMFSKTAWYGFRLCCNLVLIAAGACVSNLCMARGRLQISLSRLGSSRTESQPKLQEYPRTSGY